MKMCEREKLNERGRGEKKNVHHPEVLWWKIVLRQRDSTRLDR